ncbi:MAG: alpha/beta hydrolase [Deltaproteobacteria bacterium]|nr:alpha/beta hydrolase [Deltaproteobacteria bacterium]
MHYLEWGTATNPPLVLLHGGSAHAHWWEHLTADLARAYWVLALDLRGHGDSAWITPPAYEIEDYVADLEDFISRLGLAPLILLGHSLGGFIALTYASAHAEALRALVVVDMGFRLRQSRRLRLLSHFPAPIYQDEEDLLRRFRLLPPETRVPVSLLHDIARHSVCQLPDGRLSRKFDRATLTREPRDLTSRLPHLTCPALFLRGSESQNLSTATLAEMVALCPQAHGLEIPEAGHHVFLDHPVAFLQAVRSFLPDTTEEFTCKT